MCCFSFFLVCGVCELVMCKCVRTRPSSSPITRCSIDNIHSIHALTHSLAGTTTAHTFAFLSLSVWSVSLYSTHACHSTNVSHHTYDKTNVKMVCFCSLHRFSEPDSLLYGPGGIWYYFVFCIGALLLFILNIRQLHRICTIVRNVTGMLGLKYLTIYCTTNLICLYPSPRIK